MLYLSQRKILQINRMAGNPPPPPAPAPPPPPPPASAPPPAQAQAYAQQNLQPSVATDNVDGAPPGQNENTYSTKLSPTNLKNLENEISIEVRNIEKNRESLKNWKLLAGFFAFCSVAIGIGTNMKYGPGNMSAFESLSGKQGLNGSINDPLRGLNYGFAVFGFTIPIIGTLFSIICALVKNNEINKSLHNNQLRNIVRNGIYIDKKSPIIIQNSVVAEIVEGVPRNDISVNTAMTLAEVVYEQQKRDNKTIRKFSLGR